jgi:hypothetical protein
LRPDSVATLSQIITRGPGFCPVTHMSLDLRSREDSRQGRFSTVTMWGRVRYFIVAAGASLQARRMLARAIRPYKSRGSPHIPPHLLRDLGLHETQFDDRRNYWDHQ